MLDNEDYKEFARGIDKYKKKLLVTDTKKVVKESAKKSDNKKDKKKAKPDKTKFNYCVGQVYDNGRIGTYTYHSEVFFGDIEDANDFLEYVEKKDPSPPFGWKIFKLVELEDEEYVPAKTFDISKKEYKKFLRWNKKYPTDYCGAAGGGVTYTFTPTGFGSIIRITKLHKGEEITIDITDYDSF